MTDSWDRRCLLTILADFYNPKLVSDPKYMFSPSGYYYAPAMKGENDYDNCIEFIKVKHLDVQFLVCLVFKYIFL